jgi:hypothetical protein
MARQRNHLFPVLVTLLAVLCSHPSRASPAPEIVVPNPLAVELPAGVTGLGVDDEPIKALIAAAHPDAAHPDGEHIRITAMLPRDRIGAGVWRVIWSAWDAGARDRPVARRESFLFVLPHGMIPVAMSGKVDATAGNNATHIARDPSGYVHMVWTDSWRQGARDGAMYRRARVLPDGTAQFETGILDLGQHPSDWTAMPALAVAGDTVHFAWQSSGTVRYRSLTRDGDAWRWSDEADTQAPSPGRDTGPSIAADANAVHILTPAGIYTSSRDGGLTWATEPVPFGTDQHVKTVSLALDSEGRPLAAASSVVLSQRPLSADQGHGGYWTIRLARRTAPGTWERLPGPVDGRPEWAAPDQPNQDVLTDWVRVLEDRAGAIHVTWHGTAVSRIFGNDRAYYAWRAPDGTWRAPIPLRDPDPDRGIGWSYAPSLTLDEDRALALSFYAMHVGRQDRGYDSDLRLFRDGRSLVPALPVTRFAEDSIVTGEPENALSAWFPGAAPSLFRGPDGKVWADILVALVPTGVAAPALIVWERLDLTGWLKTAGQ